MRSATIPNLTSRRGVLRGGAVAGGGALALALAGSGISIRNAAAQDGTPVADSPFEAPVDVINYALTLEHLESTFYREGLEQFDDAAFEAAGFQGGEGGVREYVAEIAAHEAAHVETLIGVVEDLGGEPVVEAEYDFGYEDGDLTGFLTVAAALENTGVDAYTGAAQYLIEEDDLLTAALTIHGVEARHAAYLNILTGTSPFPDAVDAPLTPDEVLAIAGPFIVGDVAVEDEGTPEA